MWNTWAVILPTGHHAEQKGAVYLNQRGWSGDGRAVGGGGGGVLHLLSFNEILWCGPTVCCLYTWVPMPALTLAVCWWRGPIRHIPGNTFQSAAAAWRGKAVKAARPPLFTPIRFTVQQDTPISLLLLKVLPGLQTLQADAGCLWGPPWTPVEVELPAGGPQTMMQRFLPVEAGNECYLTTCGGMGTFWLPLKFFGTLTRIKILRIKILDQSFPSWGSGPSWEITS